MIVTARKASVYRASCRASYTELRAKLRAKPPYARLCAEPLYAGLRAKLRAEPPYAELRAELRAEPPQSFVQSLCTQPLKF